MRYRAAWAMALARGDEGAVSPLVVHGPSGVGKSTVVEYLRAEHYLSGAVTEFRVDEDGLIEVGAEFTADHFVPGFFVYGQYGLLPGKPGGRTWHDGTASFGPPKILTSAFRSIA